MHLSTDTTAYTACCHILPATSSVGSSENSQCRTMHPPTAPTWSPQLTLRNSWSPIKVNKQLQFSQDYKLHRASAHKKLTMHLENWTSSLFSADASHTNCSGHSPWGILESHVGHRCRRLGRVQQAGCICSLVLATQHLSGEVSHLSGAWCVAIRMGQNEIYI